MHADRRGSSAPDRAASTTARWCATWTSTTPISRRRDLPSERQPRARAGGLRVRATRTGARSSPRWRSPTRCSAGSRDVAPVRAKGFDHTIQGAYAVAAGVARALGLDAAPPRTRSRSPGTSLNALRVTRTGELSHWKGLAYPATASGATQRGVPRDARRHRPARGVRGQQGFHGRDRGPFEVDWSREDLERSGARSSSGTTLRSIRSRRSRRCSTCAQEHGAARGGRRADRARHLPGRLRHHRRRRGGRQDARPPQGGGRPLAALPARRRDARRPGAARAVPARADRAPDVQDLLRRVDVRPDPGLSAPLPGRARRPRAPAPARRPPARARAARLRGLPHPPDGLGDGHGEVRAARFAARRSPTSARGSSTRSSASSRSPSTS